ncbi:MAG: FAD:protein FMN transferase [Planctomycetota bacterium]
MPRPSDGPGDRTDSIRLATAAMGARFEMVLPLTGWRPEDLRAVGEDAVALIEGLHRRWSRFDRASLVSAIVRDAGQRVRVDSETYRLLTLAETARERSGGAFAAAYGEDGRGVAMELTPGAVRLPQSASLDVGGIAKGVALDLAAERLQDEGVERAFLHGGASSAAAIGLGPGDAPWRVRLAGFGVDGAPEPDVELKDACLSVSMVHPAERGAAHVIDRRTGLIGRVDGAAACVGRLGGAGLADARATALAIGAGWKDTEEDHEIAWTTWTVGVTSDAAPGSAEPARETAR